MIIVLVVVYPVITGLVGGLPGDYQAGGGLPSDYCAGMWSTR